MAETWSTRIGLRNAEIEALGRGRRIRSIAAGDPTVDFASNDYLGLSQHPAVIDAAHGALDRDGAGSGAARLVVGSRPVHDELEAALARHCDRGSALVFPTGYQANLGLLSSLAAAAQDPVIFSDELNHASIIDGCRLARAETVVFRHRDVEQLAELMSEHGGRPAIVVSDSVFSMDGDLAPIDELAQLCEHHDALLVLDTAHGVLSGPPPDSAVLVGTMSKTLGSLGGYVAADGATIELLTSTARSFIFTTASTPADAAAALAALDVLHSEQGAQLLGRLRSNIDHLRPGHPSPILPLVLGDEQRALDVAAALHQHGLLVPAIRPPTVAPGTCRLRIAVAATHTEHQLDRLREVLDDLGVLDRLGLVDPDGSSPSPLEQKGPAS